MQAFLTKSKGNDEDAADLLLERTLAWKEGDGKYDIVVVNAGRGLAGGILNSDESQWQDLYQVNVLGAANLMRRAAQYMVQQKSGDIVIRPTGQTFP